jgi:hypothetical protein
MLTGKQKSDIWFNLASYLETLPSGEGITFSEMRRFGVPFYLVNTFKCRGWIKCVGDIESDKNRKHNRRWAITSFGKEDLKDMRGMLAYCEKMKHNQL